LPKFPTSVARNLAYFGLLLIGCVGLVLGVSLCLPGRLDAVVIADQGPSPAKPIVGAAVLVAGLAAVVFGCLKFGPNGSDGEDAPSQIEVASKRLALAVLSLAAACSVALVGRDLFITRSGDIEGQVRILHLFTYNYERAFPKSLDFKPALLAFSVVAVLTGLLFALPRVQRHAAALYCAIAVLFSAWCMNVYLVKLAPHWGQRETMVAYYQQRESDKEKLVAYQMNWKGENFYTGNRMATWVSSGAKFKEWVKKQREKGVKTMFFTTEHSRVGTLKKELDNPKQFELLTDDKVNNKFFLAKVTFDELPAESADSPDTAPAAPGAARAAGKTAKPSRTAPSASAKTAPGNADKPD
jgi:hypothetical protein